MRATVPRFMVAATASGVGKTTLTCALLYVLEERGVALKAFKCGPDYLDPMFHTRVLGTPSKNLDLFLGGEGQVRRLVARGGHDGSLAVIEGAMGFYDGIADGCEASAYAVAHATETPVILVVDGRGKALSAAAEVRGFASLRSPSHIAGVIVNRVPAGYAPTMKAMIERETGLPVLGCIPRVSEASLESRHLGLVSAAEVADLRERVEALAAVVREAVDVDALLGIAQSAPPLEWERQELPAPCEGHPVIALSCDEAFSFMYQDSVELLEALGARVVPFSPLHDQELPPDTCGLYLCGGYPELHAQELSDNERMRNAVRAAVRDGLPTIAECGGFMYLQQTLENEQGVSWPMVGALPGNCHDRGRLVRFGYVELTAQRDGLLAQTGERLAAHEFHHWDSDFVGDAFVAHKPHSARSWDCVVANGTLYAGFPHLYLAGNPSAAKRFVDACAVYGRHGGEARP